LKEINVVLAGNPNVGKSTIFNNLTGLHQHTGNWAGKTVSDAEGKWQYGDLTVNLIDAPGCYSLNAASAEEEVARDVICDPTMDGVIVVCDATHLERNMILLLQILAHRRDVVLCINLMDLAEKEGLTIDVKLMEKLLGIRVITTFNAAHKTLEKDLYAALKKLIGEKIEYKAFGFVPELLDEPEKFALKAESIAEKVINRRIESTNTVSKLDRLLTNPYTGFPLMAAMLLFIFWITIQGANYPSDILGKVLFSFEKPLWNFLEKIGFPLMVCDMFAHGMYKVLAWVVSVMLPPMAIFFPMFTMLEEWGLLPRIAFNLDRCFRCCDACGKQALTMCMGLGCNASAVVGCRIIDSRRERLLAMVTNTLVPCNGRFPILISITTVFFAGQSKSLGALCITLVILLGVAGTLILTKLLSSTLLKGEPSSFTLELPLYRKPDFLKVIIRSVLDRTLFVLARAIAVAAPCGLLIWIMANIVVGNQSIVNHLVDFFDPMGRIMGLDGVIIVAFIIGIPANEIVLPIAMMIYMREGVLTEITDISFFSELLMANGWTMLTALNVMIFTLMHWPCATTLLSIKKESGSWFWTAVSAIGPTAMGVVLCMFTTFLYSLLL